MMRSLADDEARFYTTHSGMTDPAERAPLLDALPADPARLVAAVSGLLLHPLFVAGSASSRPLAAPTTWRAAPCPACSTGSWPATPPRST